MKDSDGRPDEEVAAECWKNHKARNDSVIVDVCQVRYFLILPTSFDFRVAYDCHPKSYIGELKIGIRILLHANTFTHLRFSFSSK